MPLWGRSVLWTAQPLDRLSNSYWGETMRTRILRKVVVVLLLTLLALPAGVLAKKTVWNVSIFGPSRAVTRGVEKTKELMEAEGKGDFEMKLHYAESLAPAKENLDSIKIGAFEGGMICAGYHPAKLPLTSVIELPFIMTRDIRVNAKIQEAVMNHPAVVQEWKKRWNAMYFQLTLLPNYEFMGNRRIGGVDDMKGVRMRISGLNATVLADYGAVPTMVTSPETYDALSKGTIDMIGYPYAYAFGAFKLYEVSKYSTEGMAMGGFYCGFAVALDAFNDLPPNLQAMLPRLKDEANEAVIAAYVEADAKYIPIFKERLEVVQFPEAERQKLVDKASPHWKKWAEDLDKQGLPGTEILNFTVAQRKKFSS